MNQRRLPTIYLIIGWVVIVPAAFNLFLILTGRAWNCPQPAMVDVSRGLIFAGGIFLGVGFIIMSKRSRLSMAFMAAAGLAGVLGIVFFFQTPSAPCSRSDRTPTSPLSSHPIFNISSRLPNVAVTPRL